MIKKLPDKFYQAVFYQKNKLIFLFSLNFLT
ncbi:hypothetical protein SASC598J21_022620 [Snodgrassella alvi SCGC AB-598-J21]|uniref:Uncharacterized protein n=1 Tax=Snodgrassella alvi SCGC AB-598-J21 TaxID=1385367 RepID=A0A074V3L9_9NEIS|nr:hypothetical protein SASC598J21_022620 [Snodgrassella alvi SCGC AB-598-J21]